MGMSEAYQWRRRMGVGVSGLLLVIALIPIERHVVLGSRSCAIVAILSRNEGRPFSPVLCDVLRCGDRIHPSHDVRLL